MYSNKISGLNLTYSDSPQGYDICYILLGLKSFQKKLLL